MLALGAACCAAFLKPGLSPEARQRMVVRMMLATFGLVLLTKILFKVQVAHYGFARVPWPFYCSPELICSAASRECLTTRLMRWEAAPT